MKTFQHYLNHRLTLLLIVIASISSIACGYYYAPDFFSIFYPETTKIPVNTSHTLYTSSIMAPLYEYDVVDTDSLNVNDWMTYTKGSIKRAEFKNGLYNEDRNMRPLIDKLRQQKYADAATYLGYLNSFQKIQNSFDEWTPTNRDSIGMQQLIPSIESAYSNTKDAFLKERYLYLTLRAYQFNYQYKNVIGLYEKSTFTNQTFTYWLIRSLYAGALYWQGQADRSFYEFSQVINNSDARRRAALASLNIYNIGFKKAALKFCKNDAEKANVLATALLHDSDDIGLIDQIYAINANHPMLEAILHRHIRLNEYDIHFIDKVKNDEYVEDYEKDEYAISDAKVMTSKAQLIKLKKTVDLFCNDVKVNDRPYYYICKSLIHYLLGEYNESKTWLKLADNTAVTGFRKKQVLIINTLLYIAQASNYDDTGFTKVYQDITTLVNMSQPRDVSVLQKIGYALSNYFDKKINPKDGLDDTERQFELRKLLSKRLLNIGESWSDEKTTYLIEDFYDKNDIDTLHTSTLNRIEDFIVNGKCSKADKAFIQLINISNDDIYLAQARRYMTDGNVEAASKYYKKLSPTYKYNYYWYNDKPSTVNDWFTVEESFLDLNIHLDNGERKPINRKTILANIEKYNGLVKAQPNNAEYRYMLAMNLLNVSYFGSSSSLSKGSRSNYEMEYNWSPFNPSQRKKFTTEEYYTLNQINAHLNAALASKPSKELGAKIAYLGALVEHYQYYRMFHTTVAYDYDTMDSLYAEYRVSHYYPKYNTFFKKLSSDYKNTAYEKMVLKECTWYATYLRDR